MPHGYHRYHEVPSLHPRERGVDPDGSWSRATAAATARGHRKEGQMDGHTIRIRLFTRTPTRDSTWECQRNGPFVAPPTDVLRLDDISMEIDDSYPTYAVRTEVDEDNWYWDIILFLKGGYLSSPLCC